MGCDFDRRGLMYVSIKNGLRGMEELVSAREVQSGPVTAGGPPSPCYSSCSTNLSFLGP